MMLSHVAILKANQGELRGLVNLDERTKRKLSPLFEIGRLTDAIRERRYIQNSRAPVTTHLDRVLDAVGAAWSGLSGLVDGYQWAPDALVENGQHVICYMVEGLQARGISITPVVGYDRWGNPAYRFGMKAVTDREDARYCLRLDSSALDDAAEPEYFRDTIVSIVDELALDLPHCPVLLDFADVSMATMSVDLLVSQATDVIRQMQSIGFEQFILAGCSLPRTIDLAVSSRDSQGMVLRKEHLVWQILRESLPEVRIVNGDYGVRGPTTTEIRSKYTNGKIRHTTKMQMFVVRGHAFFDDHSNAQMCDLAKVVVRSPHFLGETFSWGDSRISHCSSHGAFGSASDWIAIDTNHHLAFVVQEVEEFERSLVRKVRVERRARA